MVAEVLYSQILSLYFMSHFSMAMSVVFWLEQSAVAYGGWLCGPKWPISMLIFSVVVMVSYCQ